MCKITKSKVTLFIHTSISPCYSDEISVKAGSFYDHIVQNAELIKS